MLLGLDLGTTNVKAAVAERDGRVLGRGAAPVKLIHLDGGGVEQDLGEIWAATRDAIRQAARAVDPAGIRAVGISSQGGALQILDANGQPLGRIISWLDSRGQPEDEALTRELGRPWFLQRIWHGGSGLAVGQLLRLRREQPQLLAPPHRVGFVGDIIVGRLCGRAAHDGTSCALTLLYDPRRRDYAVDLLGRLGLVREQVPALIEPDQPAGALLPEIAAELGLHAGIPVSTAIHDQYACALGTGAVQAGDLMIGTGTAWVLLAILDRLADPVTDEALVCHHVIPGLFGQILSLRNGGSAFQWGLALLGWEPLPRAEIDRRLSAVPAGCNGLRCRPLLGAFGAVGVPPSTKGCLDGLQLGHTPAHLLRAILEGLVFELNRHLLLLRGKGIAPQRLIMAGGAAASRVTPQLMADVTGLRLTRLDEAEGSLRGALVLARRLLPGQAPLRELAMEMAPHGKAIIPGPNAAFYQEQFYKYMELLRSPRLGKRRRVGRAVPGEPHNGTVSTACGSPGTARLTPLYHVWHYTDVDRAFWAEHLEAWVPRRLIDAHTHIGDPKFRLAPMSEAMRRQYWVNEVFEPIAWAEADRCYATVFPGREFTAVAFGVPDLDFDLATGNRYVQQGCQARGWHSLVVAPPQWTAEQLAAELAAPGVIGVKPYYALIGRGRDTRDAHLEAGIFDFLPHHLLEVLHERHAWVTLHVPKAARLGHPDNLRDIFELRRRYPNIALVIAHLGRCYTEPHAREALPRLAEDPGIYVDTSAVLNPACHRVALEHLGFRRVIYGSDNPILYMRGRRQYRDRAYVNRTNYPFYFNQDREPPEIEARYTLYMYEDLLALKQACHELGLTAPGHAQAIFHDNAARLIEAALKHKP